MREASTGGLSFELLTRFSAATQELGSAAIAKLDHFKEFNIDKSGKRIVHSHCQLLEGGQLVRIATAVDKTGNPTGPLLIELTALFPVRQTELSVKIPFDPETGNLTRDQIKKIEDLARKLPSAVSLTRLGYTRLLGLQQPL